MPRLISQQGVVVNVSDEKAARLGSGWASLDEASTEDKPAPRKRAAKSDSK